MFLRLEMSLDLFTHIDRLDDGINLSTSQKLIRGNPRSGRDQQGRSKKMLSQRSYARKQNALLNSGKKLTRLTMRSVRNVLPFALPAF